MGVQNVGFDVDYVLSSLSKQTI